MRKIIITSLLAIGLTAGSVYAHGTGWQGSQMGHGMKGGGHGCQMMGPGMMGGGHGGQMMGHGMMGRGHGGQMMGHGMMGRGHGGYGNCPCSDWFGQNYQSNEGYQKFMEDTVGIRKELNNKYFEYREAQRNPNTTREQLSSIENEILDLKKQLKEKSQQYR